MAEHDMDQKKADVATIQAGRCPECGIDLTKVDAKAHADTEWPTDHQGYQMAFQRNPDAQRRKTLVLNFHKQQEAQK